jgi:Spy/CpxP family protein refolding chaperone
MTKFTHLALTLLAAATVASAASASTCSPYINRREREQAWRIHQGVRSGELTRGETRSLWHQEREIREDEREAKRDGKFTLAERRDLNRELNRESHRIYRLKHNDVER